MNEQKGPTVNQLIQNTKDAEIGRLTGRVIELQAYNTYYAGEVERLAKENEELKEKLESKEKTKKKKGE